MPVRALTRILLVFAGGAVGAVLRAMLLALPSTQDPRAESFWLAAINVVGSFMLGSLLGALSSPAVTTTFRSDALRALLGTGLLGGFTSYSTLVLLTLPAGGALPTGILLAAVSLAAGVAAAAAGLALGERIGGRRAAAGQQDPEPDQGRGGTQS